MKKIAVLQDLSGLGKCSLTAAIPVISAMGVQACPLPTAVLSNQTGYDSYYCDDYTDKIPLIMKEWEKRNFSPDGIYTGFLAGEAQIEIILEFLKRFRKEGTKVIVDPVMGDDGKPYKFYTEDLCRKLRSLVSKADVITPNLTEALLLLEGGEGMEETWELLFRETEEKHFQEGIEAVGTRLLSCYTNLKGAAVTGIHFASHGDCYIGNLIVERGKSQPGAERLESSWVYSPKRGGSYSGTGDLFASVISAGAVKGERLSDSAKRAVRFLEKAIADAVEEGTDRNDGVCFEPYLRMLAEE